MIVNVKLPDDSVHLVRFNQRETLCGRQINHPARESLLSAATCKTCKSLRDDALRRAADALEDAFSDLSGDAALVAISFKHLKLRALTDPEARAEVTELADKIKAAYDLLLSEGFWLLPHDAEQGRAVVVLNREEITGVAGYIAEGLGEEWSARIEGVDSGGGLSPVEYAVLPSIEPYLGWQDKRLADDLLHREADEEPS